MSGLRTYTSNGVATIEWSNPAKRNALTLEMALELAQKVTQLAEDPQVLVIVLQGEGTKAFCAGGDISQMQSQESSENSGIAIAKAWGVACTAIENSRAPVIAKIHGVCMGGGLGLAASCDLRLCADDARFGIPAARLGIGYPVEDVRKLVALIGGQHALDIFCTARTFGAGEALNMGFVCRVAPSGELETALAAMTDAIVENAPLTLRAVKLAVQCSLQPSDEGLAAAIAAQAACADSDDNREGVRAYLEKRKPRFRGE